MLLTRLFSSRRIFVAFLLTSSVLLFGAAPPAEGQDLSVHMTASSEVVGPGNRTTYTLMVANTGGSDLTDVSVEIQLPEHIENFSAPPGLDCGTCTAGEVTDWSVGTLGGGQNRSVFYRVQIDESAPDEPTTSSATASATGSTDASTSLDIEIDGSPLVQLSVAPESGPAVADTPFVYTLTFGNTGSTSASDVVLTMPLPSGTSFVSASNGGSESSGTVTWDIGSLGVGVSGQRQVTVLPDAGLNDGDVLQAVATLDPNETTEPVARSSAAIPVRSSGTLRLEYGVSQTAVEPGGQVTYALTATNTDTQNDLTDVEARILLPGFINNFSAPPGLDCGTCGANEATIWTIGTLNPGRSRTVFFRTFVQGSAPQGDIMRSILTATGTGTGPVSAAFDGHIDPSPLLRLSVAPDPGPVAPGAEFTYTLTVGNVGNTNLADATLSLPLPDGTSFASATKGGTVSDGVVSWDVGPLGVGNSRHFQLTVTPDPALGDGRLLLARATVDSGISTEVVVRSSSVISVRGSMDLHVRYGVSQTVLGAEDPIDVILTATNTSSADLTNVTARLLLPGSITNFSAPPGLNCGTCTANETTTWSIGTLSPGESRTVFFRTFLQGSNSIQQGEVLRSILTGESTGTGQVVAAQDLQIDPSPLLRLSLAPLSAPAEAGTPITYTLSVGNVGSSDPTNVVLSIPLPEGTSFNSATDGGFFNNGFVTWNVGDILSQDVAGQADLTLDLASTLADGRLLPTAAELDPGSSNEVTLRSSAAAAVGPEGALQVTLTSDKTAVLPNSTVQYTVAATNNSSFDLTDIEVRLVLPGFIDNFSAPSGLDCGTCTANESTVWAVGTLSAGQTKELTFGPTVDSNAPLGDFLRSIAMATATGSNEVVVERDVLITSEDTSPLPVELASFTGTASGETVTLSWQTASETNNAGFDVERSTDGTAFTRVGYKDGHGTTTEAQSYRFVDAEVPFADTLYYRLRQVDLDGTAEYSSVVTVGLAPRRFALLPNAPNPFQGTTRLRYTLTEDGPVSLRVYDLLGRRVATLVDREQPAGRYAVTLDGASLPSGTYFVRLQSGTQLQTQRIAVVR